MTKIIVGDVNQMKVHEHAQVWYDEIVKQRKLNAFNQYLEDCYPDGITAKAVNELLQYETETIFNAIGVEYDFYPWLNN